MAKGNKTIAALNAADKRHYQQVEKYVKVVDSQYNKAISDLSALAVRIGLPDDDSTFEFPKTKQKEVQKVIKRLADRITATIMAGDSNEWNAACAKGDRFIDAILKTSKFSRKQLAQYQARNLEALAAFQQRKVEGMNLSERVWKTVQPFQDEIELAIDTAAGTGMSAATLSRDVRSCLLEPDKLFRRVRDKYGNLHLSKAAKLYHPGQGVYRSSYKNAMRMTRTEINMAYRESDSLRWQQLDFVVGIQVQTSNNHTCLGMDGKPHPFYDICDELAGKYPKDFKFIGWHPQCRCFATPILKTLDEVDEEIDEEGNYRDIPSANEVNEMPGKLVEYLNRNAERIEGWKSVPYYIKDNTEKIVPALCTTPEGQAFNTRIKNRKLAAYLLTQDNHYKDVMFDGKTGALKATHVDHNFDKVGGQYEKAVQEAGFKDGHAVILGSEFDDKIGHKFTEGTWDGLQFEVMGCETATDNNYLRGLCHCADKRATEVAILQFPNGGFDANKMRRALGRYNGLEKLNDGQFLEFRSVVCIQDGKVLYNEAFKKGAGGSTFVVHPPHISKSGTAKVDKKPEPAKTKEQLLAEQREKQRLLTLERAKNRHDARTPEQIQAIKKFAEEHKKKTDALYDEIKATIKAVDGIASVDASKLSSLVMGKDGVTIMKSGEKVLASVEKLRKELDAVKAQKVAYDKAMKQADNILDIAKNWREVDYSALEAAIKSGDIDKIKAATKSVAKNVSAMKQQEAALSDIIPDVHEWHKQFSIEELKQAHSAVQKTIDTWLKKYNYSDWDSAPLQHKKAKLEQEIRIMETVGKKYSTWQVSRDSYTKLLSVVEHRIDMQAIKDGIASQIEAIKKSSSKVGKTLVAEFDAMFKKDNANLAMLQQKADEIAKKAASLTKKKTASAGQFVPKSDAETKQDFLDYAQKIGASIDPATVVVDNGFIHMRKGDHIKIYNGNNFETKLEHDQLWKHRQEGGLWWGAGGYIQTTNSMQMNGVLRNKNISGTIDNTAEALMKKAGLTDDDVKTIRLLDKKTQECELPVPIVVTRYVEANGLEFMLGKKLSAVNGSLQDMLTEVQKKNAGDIFNEDKGFISASTNETSNVFWQRDERKIKLVIEVPPKTKMYFTNNEPESEVIFSRETKLQYLSSKIGTTKDNGTSVDHVIIRCRIIQ